MSPESLTTQESTTTSSNLSNSQKSIIAPGGLSTSSAPPPSSQKASPPGGSQQRTTIFNDDVLAPSNFAPFDHQTKIVSPFEQDAAHDPEFKRGRGFQFCFLSWTRIYPLSISNINSPEAWMLKPYLELAKIALDAMLEFHAWATAKPMHLTDAEGMKISDEISLIVQRDEQQGKSDLFLQYRFFEMAREQLKQFIGHMQKTLAGLMTMMIPRQSRCH